MAKPFYSIEEVCAKLGKDEEGVKELVRNGSLREFRDAGKVFFKADDVDKLSGGGGDDSLTLEPGEELPNLSDTGGTGALKFDDDSPSGGTSLIGLAPSDDETDAGDRKSGTVLSSSGIGVFDDDELEIEVDPLAATHVSDTPAAGRTDFAGGESSSLEGTGSGLLDLEREADDTKLGAELLDEIYPGEEDDASASTPPPAPAIRKPAAAAPEEYESIPPPPAVVGGPVAAVAYATDANDGLFAGILAGSLIPLVVAGSVAAASLQHFQPAYAEWLTDQFWFLLGGAVLSPLLGAGIGWVVGRR